MHAVMFLDVDGVVNALARAATRRLVPTQVPGPMGREWIVHLAPPVLARLARVLDSDIVRPRWLTTWGSLARDHLAPAAGLPDIEHEPSPETLFLTRQDAFRRYCLKPSTSPDDQRTWWKTALVLDHTATDPVAPLIWVDDEITQREREAVQEALQGTPSLLLAPQRERGLTPGDLDQIEDFLTDPATWRSADLAMRRRRAHAPASPAVVDAA